MSERSKTTIQRSGDLILIDDHDSDGRVRDFFLATQARAVTCEWDDDGDPVVRVTFLDGSYMDWFDVSTLDVARVIWPTAVNDLDDGTLLAAAERES